jgi:ADP-ribose pyrophosphatase
MEFTPNDVEILDKERVYEGVFHIDRYHCRHRLFKGGWTDVLIREIFERGNAVGVLLYDPHLDKVVLIEEFRIGALHHHDTPWLIEVVAGVMKPGETPEEVASREVTEEAGLTLLKLMPICHYLVSPGGTTEKIWLFCGKVDASQAGGIFGLPDEHEDIRVHVLSPSQAFAMLAEGKIVNAMTIIALQWLQLNESRVKKHWEEMS